MKFSVNKKSVFLMVAMFIAISLRSENLIIYKHEKEIFIKTKNTIHILDLSNIEKFKETKITEDSLKNTNNYIPSFEFQVAFGIGGESKVAIFLPRTNFILKHNVAQIALYYGVGAGLHHNFQTGYGIISGILGIQYDVLDFEISISDLAIPKENFGILDSEGDFHQNLINLKVGLGTEKIKVRGSISKVLFDGFPIDETRSGFIDIGMKEDFILGIELLFIVNKF